MNAKSFKRGLALSISITAVCAAVSALFALETFVSYYFRVAILVFAFLLTAPAYIFQIKRLQSALKEREEQLEICDRRYKIFNEFSDNVHIDVDIAGGQISFNSNFDCLFGQKPGIEKLSEWRSLLSFIVLEDLQEVIKAWESAVGGSQQSSCEIRVIDADRRLLWFRLSFVAQFGKNGEAIRVLGRLTSIDAEVRRMKRQRLKAMQDPLTHLYNRMAAEALVDELLKSDGKRAKHAMLIIEIENVKALSDTSLLEFSKILRKVFRLTDILARLSTGEFMVFLRDIPADYILEYKVLNLLKSLDSYNSTRKDEVINCCIGTAFYGSGGTSFIELCEAAEESLYPKIITEKSSISFFPVQDTTKTAAF